MQRSSTVLLGDLTLLCSCRLGTGGQQWVSHGLPVNTGGGIPELYEEPLGRYDVNADAKAGWLSPSPAEMPYKLLVRVRVLGSQDGF